MVEVTGPVKGGPKDLRGQVIRVLLPAMRAEGVRRLVFLTGAGVRVEGDAPREADRAIRGVMRLLQPEILASLLLDEVDQGRWTGTAPVVSW